MALPTLADIKRGRVFFLNPQNIAEFSSTSEDLNTYNTAGREFTVLGGNSPHYFVCLGRAHNNEHYSFWSPMSSNVRGPRIGSRTGQGQIPQDQKHGFSHFMNHFSWYDAEQIWMILNEAVLFEARTNRANKITQGTFNYISDQAMDDAFGAVVVPDEEDERVI
ncbi:hypothetical protein [Pseudomonas brassicacearum]|uniref:hypothetical protein n=1 Tax=Pseudomonas brassicacearum TaxID=930166 RepID=UPI003D6C3056